MTAASTGLGHTRGRAIAVYEIRPAEHDDLPGMADVLERRRTAAKSALVQLPADDGLARFVVQGAADFATLVLTEDAQVLGWLALGGDLPDLGWSAAERAEPSLVVASACGDPRPEHRRVAHLMTLWCLDYAAGAACGAAWVRRMVSGPGRMRQLCAGEGWVCLRPACGSVVYLLQQRPRALPGLSALIRTAPEVTGCIATGRGLAAAAVGGPASGHEAGRDERSPASLIPVVDKDDDA